MKWLKEFCKALAIWAVIICTLTVAASFLWAALGWVWPDSLAIAVVTACFGLLGAYQAKSAFETHSRNEHGLDKDGNPRGDNNV